MTSSQRDPSPWVSLLLTFYLYFYSLCNSTRFSVIFPYKSLFLTLHISSASSSPLHLSFFLRCRSYSFVLLAAAAAADARSLHQQTLRIYIQSLLKVTTERAKIIKYSNEEGKKNQNKLTEVKTVFQLVARR